MVKDGEDCHGLQTRNLKKLRPDRFQDVQILRTLVSFHASLSPDLEPPIFLVTTSVYDSLERVVLGTRMALMSFLLSPHLSSDFIVVQIKSRPSVIAILQSVYKAPSLLFSISYVITAPAPLPIVCFFPLFLDLGALTSGNVAPSALMRDLVCNGGSANGVNESCFSSCCNKTTLQEVRIQKN